MVALFRIITSLSPKRNSVTNIVSNDISDSNEIQVLILSCGFEIYVLCGKNVGL